jgi:hypothetical protein
MWLGMMINYQDIVGKLTNCVDMNKISQFLEDLVICFHRLFVIGYIVHLFAMVNLSNFFPNKISLF